MLKILLKTSESLEKIVSIFGKFGSWLAIPLISIIIFDIITRRFFVLGSTKLQEMEWHLHAALFLLALGYAYVKNSHVRIEVIRESFSSKLKSYFVFKNFPKFKSELILSISKMHTLFLNWSKIWLNLIM